MINESMLILENNYYGKVINHMVMKTFSSHFVFIFINIQVKMYDVPKYLV